LAAGDSCRGTRRTRSSRCRDATEVMIMKLRDYRSRVRIRVLAAVFAAAVSAALPAAGFQDAKEPTKGDKAKANVTSGGDAKKGKQLYTSYGCYQCHGYAAQGATATGPRLAPRPIPFQAFVPYVRHPNGEMPPYTEKIVTDSELRDIYA